MWMSPAALQRALDKVTAAAVAGVRCPTNPEIGSDSFLPALARAGAIKIEIYAQNFRVVEIMEGAHRGARTAPRPGDSRAPWRVIYRNTAPQHRAGAV